jgi:hypothetical protein
MDFLQKHFSVSALAKRNADELMASLRQGAVGQLSLEAMDAMPLAEFDGTRA